ncbi:DUF4326 domain-containing protein [Mycolicibacterium goodii]|nr:DUF4326 domain-containing protein [Mycolicibacterium goodii]
MHICRGCDGTYDTCQPLWAQQRKCCPDCTHTHHPKRIQRKRTKGWRMTEGAIYVGRPSRWGNPFFVEPWRRGEFRVLDLRPGFRWGQWWFSSREDAAAFAVQRYRETMTAAFAESVAQLRGRDLACWCSLVDDRGNPVPCHADVLLELANQEATA